MEYLDAVGDGLLAEKVEASDTVEPMNEALHLKLIGHLKMYLFLGGMPEVLQNYIDNKDIKKARKIQNEILKAYERDFSKYNDKSQAIKTSEVRCKKLAL